MNIRNDDARMEKPALVMCPRCAESVLIAVIERGPTHDVYECVKCHAGFAKAKPQCA